MTEAQKQEDRLKAQQYAELQGIAYVDPHPETPNDNPNPPAANLDDLSDEQLLQIVNKRTGTVLSSLQDLKPKPTPEQIAEQEKERQSAMLTYGLTSGKFKKEEYDAYQQAVANKISVVREDVKAQFETAFPELSPEAIEEKVANYLFEHLDPSDTIRQAREKELITLSDLKIKDKFKNIVNLPKDYEMYEEGLNKQVNFEKKVQATLPVYKADVSRALESLRKFSVPVPDSKNPENTVVLELQYSDADLKEVESALLTNDQIVRAVKEGLTFDQIKGEAELVLLKKHLPRLMSQVAKNYNATQRDNYRMARKGLNGGSDFLQVSDDKLNDSLEDVYQQMIESSNTTKN